MQSKIILWTILAPIFISPPHNIFLLPRSLPIPPLRVFHRPRVRKGCNLRRNVCGTPAKRNYLCACLFLKITGISIFVILGALLHRLCLIEVICGRSYGGLTEFVELLAERYGDVMGLIEGFKFIRVRFFWHLLDFRSPGNNIAHLFKIIDL